MIRRFSFILARHIANKNNVNHEIRGVYYYILQLILFMIVETVLILTVSFLFNCFHQTLFVLVGFVPIRQKFGGYHLDSYEKCIISSLFSFLFLGLFSRFIEQILDISFVYSISLGAIFAVFVQSKLGYQAFCWFDKFYEKWIKI